MAIPNKIMNGRKGYSNIQEIKKMNSSLKNSVIENILFFLSGLVIIHFFFSILMWTYPLIYKMFTFYKNFLSL